MLNNFDDSIADMWLIVVHFANLKYNTQNIDRLFLIKI